MTSPKAAERRDLLVSPNGFDPHFTVFHELMAFKVQEILLVSSPYDAYIMEEDNSMTSRIINEYHGLNLSRPPRITRATTARNALEILDGNSFDLIITMPHLGEMDGYCFGREVKQRYPDLPVILLAHSVRDAVIPGQTDTCSCIDNVYVWCCDSDILLAIVKNVEDSLNVETDTAKAMVRVILLVEDSPLYRSQLLPMLYAEVVRQTQSVLDEGLNEKHRLLKMRARPKILTAASYEEAIAIFAKYRQYIFCVLSDVRFPKNGRLDEKAGVDLLAEFRYQQPDLPLLLLSTDAANRTNAEFLSAAFVEKNTKKIRQKIHDFFLRYLGFGDFVFCLPDGTEVGRAKNLHDFEARLKTVPLESILYHGRNNHFSNWAMARAEIALAIRLHKRFFQHAVSGEILREELVRKVHALRKIRQQGVVAQFDRHTFDPEIMDFVRIGKGSMGGKARGLAFISSWLYRSMEKSEGGSQTIIIPRTCVITANGFNDFILQNDLSYQEGASDDDIADRFLQASLPEWLAGDLRAFLEKIHGPLSVRSSSLLEDAQSRPYAGLYSTFMLVNGAEDIEIRYRQLQQAVKLVYASTWYAGPRAFSRSIGQTMDDSMAVIIQQLAGSRYNGWFYPAISGVAQSYNYYPIAPMTSQDGIAHVAVGFGKTVVEGEQSLRFSPAYPDHLPQFSTVDDILANAQRWMYCLDCTHPEEFSHEQGNLVRRPIDEAVDELPIRMLSSTFFPEEYRIRDGDLPGGSKVLTFASILKYGSYPLPDVLKELLEIGKRGMGCEVEIEFAVDLHRDPAQSVFYFLQIRPIVTGNENLQIRIREEERKRSILCSKRALGHGRYEAIRDIVFVRQESFDVALTKKIATEISRINSRLDKAGRPYLLIGPGRWGTADPWLGIPVRWDDISGVGAIVELQDCSIRAEPSQGTHFFQNITSLGIPYLMVQDARCAADKPAWLDQVDRPQQTMKIPDSGTGKPLLPGFSDKPAWLDQIGRPQQTMKIPDFGMGKPLLPEFSDKTKNAEFIDWEFIQGLDVVGKGDFVTRVTLADSFVLKVDGHTSEAVFYPAGD